MRSRRARRPSSIAPRKSPASAPARGRLDILLALGLAVARDGDPDGVHGGASKLVLPARPRRRQDEDPAPFASPETAPPLEIERLKPPRSGGRRMTWDVDSDTVEYEFRWVDGGRDLQKPWGIVTQDHVTYRYRITEGGPLSGRSRLVADSDLVRGDVLDVHVHTDCELRSDETTFFVTDHQRVTDHGEAVWERTWETSIPRDLG